MDCCAPTTPAADAAADEPGSDATGPGTISRRSMLQGLAAGAGGLALAACGFTTGGDGGDDLASVRLAFCGQLLCVVPYEITRTEGFFADEGLDMELVYSNGGSAAVQALNGGAVDYAASSFDAQVNAVANGATVRRYMTTGRLPLFALGTSPASAGEITAVEDLQGRRVAVSALGNADHTIALYLLDQAGIDVDSVEFATVGTNLYDVLRLGQVDVGMLQEPALSLLKEEGGRELVNFMKIEDTRQVFGGAYEFMGVSIRDGEQQQRSEQMHAIARALRRGLAHVRTADVEGIVEALPNELIAGQDQQQLISIVDQYRTSLWPEQVVLDQEAAQRVVDALSVADVLPREVTLDEMLDPSVLA